MVAACIMCCKVKIASTGNTHLAGVTMAQACTLLLWQPHAACLGETGVCRSPSPSCLPWNNQLCALAVVWVCGYVEGSSNL